jgi:hypothetical protein
MERRTFIATGVALLATPAFAGGHGKIGTFTGASDHVTSGRVEVVVADGKATINLLDDFFFDGAPDPKVALGNNGYDASTLMGPLTSNTGASTYAVPDSIDVNAYNEVWIWCERFNVPLGVAKF